MSQLTLLWLLPAVWGCCVLLAPKLGRTSARAGALAASVVVFVYALWLWIPFSAGGMLLAESGATGRFGITYSLGLDGLTLLLCWLNAFLTVVALAASWRGGYSTGFWASFLFLESAVMGVFLARDLFWFYVFWEAGLVPMFFIIGLWGSEGRRHAALKFLLYTVGGSVFMLLGLLALVSLHHDATGVWTWSIAQLSNTPIDPSKAAWIYIAIALGFAVKVPLFPLHNWLPDAHTEAPAAGSILLAGVLLKMGVYGFLRILIPIFPLLSIVWAPWIGALGAVNVIYGALCAVGQTDFKRLVAYSSISHLGFCMLGIYSFTAQGVTGGSLQLLNHGVSTGALFLLIGILYERSHRRGLADFGDLAGRAPRLAFFFAVVVLSSIGLPGLNGFVGELMSLSGIAVSFPMLAAAGVLGTLLAAWYLLPAYQKVFWAPAGPGSVSEKVHDLDLRESSLMWVLTALIVWVGLFPRPLLSILESTWAR